VPPPVPLAPLVSVSHGALLDAVHAQPTAVVTVIGDPAPPLAGRVALPGAIEKLHGGGGAADCVTVNVWPPIVSVPVRCAPVLAAAAYVTVPPPVPPAPPVTVSHDALLAAVHAHAAAVVTAIAVPAPPVDARVALDGAME
jgi:hypothetical protein